jgi:hypothetical protein
LCLFFFLSFCKFLSMLEGFNCEGFWPQNYYSSTLISTIQDYIYTLHFSSSRFTFVAAGAHFWVSPSTLQWCLLHHLLLLHVSISILFTLKVLFESTAG